MKFYIRRYHFYDPYSHEWRTIYQVVPKGSAFVHINSSGLTCEFNTRSKARNWIKMQQAQDKE